MKHPTYLPELSQYERRMLLEIAGPGKGLSQSKLSEKLALEKTKGHRLIKQLISKRLVTETKLGLFNEYELTSRGSEVLRILFEGIETKANSVRTHNLIFESKIQRKPARDWSKSGTLREVPMTNWKQYLKRDGKFHIQINPNTIVFMSKQVFARSTKEAIDSVYDHLLQTIKNLEAEFPGLVMGEPKCTTKIINQHHALLNDPFAKWCVEQGYIYRDYMGRFCVDKSTGLPELEFTDPEYAAEDCDKYLQFMTLILDPSFDLKKFREVFFLDHGNA